MAKISQAQSTEENLDGAPELVFIHGGHRGKVADFNWNPNVGEDL